MQLSISKKDNEELSHPVELSVVVSAEEVENLRLNNERTLMTCEDLLQRTVQLQEKLENVKHELRSCGDVWRVKLENEVNQFVQQQEENSKKFCELENKLTERMEIENNFKAFQLENEKLRENKKDLQGKYSQLFEENSKMDARIEELENNNHNLTIKC